MKHLIFLLTLLFPIVVIWLVWAATACSFDIKRAFGPDSVFWFMYLVYVFVWLVMLPKIIQLIYQIQF